MNMVAGRKGEITLRELGGCMSPIWHNYYKDCPALIVSDTVHVGKIF